MTAIEVGLSSEQLGCNVVGRKPDVSEKPRTACLGRKDVQQHLTEICEMSDLSQAE